MGVEPFLISASISMVIAQRLVRKICTHCIDTDKGSANKLLAMDLDKNDYENINFKIGAGCEKCNHTGYKGRSVIYEIMEVDDEMKNLISENRTSLEIKNLAVEKTFQILREKHFKNIRSNKPIDSDNKN
jgi:type IV pilus assembly protein PilB